MGYRQEVALAVSDNLSEQVKSILSGYVYTAAKIDNIEVFRNNFEKWDADFDFVKKINNLMDELDLNPELGSYKFIRLGENYGDVEERGNDVNIREIKFIHEIKICYGVYIGGNSIMDWESDVNETTNKKEKNADCKRNW